MNEKTKTLALPLRRAAIAFATLLISGCDNPVAKNLENILVWNGVDREIAQWVPPFAGAVGVYVAFRFMLSDTRKY